MNPDDIDQSTPPFVDVSPVAETPTPPSVSEDGVLTVDSIENIELGFDGDGPQTPATIGEPATPDYATVDGELESALTDLAVAGRVLSNIANAINVVIDRANSTRLATVTNPKSVSLPQVTPPAPLSARDQEIANLLIQNEGQVVTRQKFSRALGGRTGDLTSAISRIRRATGLRIESTQAMRLNGEKVGRAFGYRLTTDEQVRTRESATLIRSILSDVLTRLR